MTTLPLLLSALSPFVIFDNDYALISCLLCKSNILLNILLILGRNVEQDEATCHIQEWQLWLSYFWSYFLCFVWHRFCVRFVTRILWNILVVLGRNVEQDQTTCRVQKWQLCLSYFWPYLPLLYLTVIMHWFRVRSVCQIPFGIFWLYLVEMQNRTRRRVAYKNDNSSFLTFGVISLCFVWNRFCVCSVTWIFFRIFWWYLGEMQNRTRPHVAYKNDK